MGSVDIRWDGSISDDTRSENVVWTSLRELSNDYWRGQRLSEKEQEDDPMLAWSCVDDLMRQGHARALDIIETLLADAATDQERCNIGAGPLEDLLSHYRHGRTFVDDAVARAHTNPALRSALDCLWLSDDVPHAVRSKLEHPDRQT